MRSIIAKKHIMPYKWAQVLVLRLYTSPDSLVSFPNLHFLLLPQFGISLIWLYYFLLLYWKNDLSFGACNTFSLGLPWKVTNYHKGSSLSSQASESLAQWVVIVSISTKERQCCSICRVDRYCVLTSWANRNCVLQKILVLQVKMKLVNLGHVQT